MKFAIRIKNTRSTWRNQLRWSFSCCMLVLVLVLLLLILILILILILLVSYIRAAVQSITRVGQRVFGGD